MARPGSRMRAPLLPPPFTIRRAGCMRAPAHRYYLRAGLRAIDDRPEIGRSAVETPGVVFRNDPCSVAARRRWVSGLLWQVAAPSAPCEPAAPRRQGGPHHRVGVGGASGGLVNIQHTDPASPRALRKGADPVQPEYLHPHNHHDNGNADEERATAVLLTGGGIDGVPAFFLRHWGPGADPPEPVFVIWLLNIGRFCLTVKYGRHSLQSGQWRVDTGSGPRITPSPLEQARVEALSIREILQERLNRPITVAPALALFDTDPDRSIERLARRNRITLLWDLEGCTRQLADAAIGGRLRQPLERRQALAEISALMEGIDRVGAVSSRKPQLGFRSASAA